VNYTETCRNKHTRHPTRHHGQAWLYHFAIDVMFINSIPFVMTTSCKIHFVMAKLVKDMKNNTLVTSIEQVIQAYQSRGFKIQAELGDGQFKHIQ